MTLEEELLFKVKRLRKIVSDIWTFIKLTHGGPSA